MNEQLKKSVLERQKQRYAYLLALYELSDGSENEFVSNVDICDRIGVDAEKTGWLIVEYLKGEYLASLESMGWPESDVRITHYGVLEVESSINQPNESTTHFESQAINMVQNFYGAVGSIQNGDNAQANVQQNIGASTQDLLRIFGQMRTEIQLLPESARSDAANIISDIEQETKQDPPKPHRLKAFGSALWSVASPILSDVSKAYLMNELGVSTP